MKVGVPFAFGWMGITLVVFVLALSQSSAAQVPPWVTAEPVPHWIWDAEGSRDGQRIWLRKEFNVPSKIKQAQLYTTCDNRMTLWINGKEVGTTTEWSAPIKADVAKHLVQGNNTISVAAGNDGGVAALVLKLVIDHGGEKTTVLSEPTWKMTGQPPADNWMSADFDASGWKGKLTALKRLGGSPWGVPGAARRASSQTTSTEDINVPNGFVVDLVYRVPRDQEGSWVALTSGPDGRLIACDQGDKGAFWIEVEESTSGPQARVSPLGANVPGSTRPLSGAQGLLWAFDSLWFHKNGGHLYRIQDSNSDGNFDQVAIIPSQRGGGEHGNHAVILTEDGKGIYMDGGNHAPLAEVSRARVPTWNEDLLLPRLWDANGHARGRLAPGGWVTRLDPNTQQQELICIGFRNQYDIALNRHGDLFTYDADMEWDMGTPWYRPTRICQVVSGGDYGWRSGSGKWPAYYEDTLPPVVDIGPGSPTGVVAGTGSKFPAKYQDAIFALDWTFGTIYAIHMTPRGAGYVGTSEPFVTGAPLPVTDAVVGSDGALYFTVGGRGTQSALYRVRYDGPESTAPVGDVALPDSVQKARKLRTELERIHGQGLDGPEAKHALELAWPTLRSEDRFVRNAARVAIESLPTALWADRAIRESNPQAKITAAVALARVGEASHQDGLTNGLLSVDPASLSDSELLGLLRAYALTFIRLGKPSEPHRSAVIAQIDPLLPHRNDDVNTELIRVLTYLEAPQVLEKALKLIKNRKPPAIPDWSELATRNAGYGGTVQRILDNYPPQRELYYAFMLRNLHTGWTHERRREYFEFLNVAAKSAGGASYPGFMKDIRNDALGNCSDAERVAVQDITGETYDPVPDFEIQPIQGPGRVWTLAAARSEAANRFKEADFEKGRSLYFAANCGNCHRLAGLGGNVGPDLTTIPRKFDVSYVIEHIIDPSKVISDQYQSSSVLTADGRTLVGLLSEADGQAIIYPADPKSKPIKLASEDIEQVKPSPVSQMPKGLIDGLSADELRDLLAYLMSGGDRDNRKVYGRR